MDRRNEYADELRAQVFRTIQEDQKFYIHYSAMAIGLLMTLQAVEIGSHAVFGPFVAWLVAVLAFVVSFITNGPICYYFDEKHYASLAEEMMEDGAIGSDTKMVRILKAVNWTGRSAFAVGCISSVIYFVFQRLAAAC